MKNTEEKYLEAKHKVEKIKAFYIHLSTYIIINAVLIIYNYYENNWAYPFFLWITFGWGIGVFFDYLKAFEKNPMFNRKWEERKIKQYMAKDEERQHWE
ncbi:2TM domain-containing protein [Flavimarina sp. Hel_I_48]|uniref:2TM domain-containing protein n=1 Tax=Flavimarina sp. Hel_I_48 TaxID=1392488 RepID=UPI0004DFA77D|nr:2TM domain-containing protein [Flavimarina sp. Hel_I_48]